MDGVGLPGSVGEALSMMDAALDYLTGPAGDLVQPAALGEVLLAAAGIDAKHAAMRMRLVSRFDANDCHDSDGYPTTASWLAGRTKVVLAKARAEVRQARTMTGAHPGLAAAMAAGELSLSWAAGIAAWTAELPEEIRQDTEQILLQAAAAGADYGDLKIIATAATEACRGQHPDPDDDGKFGDRYVHVDTTMDGAGRITGDLTPECAAAVQAVLEALGKKRGREDDRTAGQRLHDALLEGCELLIRAKMVPDRAGADTRVDVHIALSQLRALPGAPLMEEAFLAARAGEHGYLAGKDAEAAACDALIVPVVTGSPDWAVIHQMITVVLDALVHGGAASAPARPLPPEARESLQYALAKLAIDFLSGPGSLASVLRTGLLGAPFNSKSVPIDVGYSENIPEPIRRAVILRDKKCAWPGGCDKRPAACDVHHVRHKKNGGPTSVKDCILLCQYHHDICIHRWGWEIELLPDGSVKAYGPKGQLIRSHGPPSAQAA
jgi:Domain of unknown function (DUF222)